MKQIKSVAFEWSADDVQRRIDYLKRDDQDYVLSRIGNQHDYLDELIHRNRFKIIELINEMIDEAIENELK